MNAGRQLLPHAPSNACCPSVSSCPPGAYPFLDRVSPDMPDLARTLRRRGSLFVCMLATAVLLFHRMHSWYARCAGKAAALPLHTATAVACLTGAAGVI